MLKHLHREVIRALNGGAALIHGDYKTLQYKIVNKKEQTTQYKAVSLALMSTKDKKQRHPETKKNVNNSTVTMTLDCPLAELLCSTPLLHKVFTHALCWGMLVVHKHRGEYMNLTKCKVLNLSW